jgi:hypothetical protein
VRKGIVMEVDERFLTLLTPEGEFLKARKQKQDYLIGQEIDFSPVNEVLKKKSLFYSLPGKAVAAAVFAIMIATASFLPNFGSNDVYAYMSIDVNPSVELAVNDELEVIKLEAYNIEGEEIISKLNNWKNQDISIVTSQIINEIKIQGYFQNHDEVIISTVYEEKAQPEIAKQLEANIEELEEEIEKENLQLTVIQGTKEERKTAQEKGITTGVLKESKPSIKKNANEKEDDKSKSSDKKDAFEDKKKMENLKNKNKEIEKEDKDKKQPPGKQKQDEKKETGKVNKDKNKKDKEKETGKEKKTVNINHQDNDNDNDEEDHDDDQDKNDNDDDKNKNKNNDRKNDKKDKKEDKEQKKNNKKNEDD